MKKLFTLLLLALIFVAFSPAVHAAPARHKHVKHHKHHRTGHHRSHHRVTKTR